MNKELYEDGSIKKTSLLLSIFQIVFTFICLYCLREVFHRWDGFSMYASFMDFLPTVALVSLLWALVAMIISVLVWFPIAAVRVIAGKLVRGISNDNIIGFYIVFIVLSFVVLYIKRHFFDMPATPLAVKAAMLFAVFTVSIVFSFLLRTVLCKLVQLISSSISPLLWIFGIWIIIAVPLVGFYTWLQPEPVKIIADSNVSDAERPNIILLTFDTLTARDMSLYGYARDTTPFMKKWAENASVFTRAQAASNYTTPTTASIVTGKRVWSHRMYHIRATNPYKSSTESMPLILKKNGYYNMAFVVNSLASVKKLGVSNSFDYDPNAAEFVEPRSFFGWNNSKFGKLDLMLYSMFGDRINFQDWIIKTDTFIVRRMKQMISDFNYTSVPVEKTFAKFIEVMDKGVPGPFFAWIHVFPPHDPYLPPKPFLGSLDADGKYSTFKSQQTAFNEIFEALEKKGKFTPKVQPIVESLRYRYDEFIKYTDAQFEIFISELSRRKILDNTVIIISADHGESFEHDYIMHGGEKMYEQVTNIPLIIKEPGQTRGVVIDTLVEQIDIPATIVSIAGTEVPEWMEGVSLQPLLRGDSINRQGGVFAMNLERSSSRIGDPVTRGTIALWEGDYKLIYFLDKKESILFNLADDPDEMKDLFHSDQETGQRMLSIIQANLTNANERILHTD